MFVCVCVCACVLTCMCVSGCVRYVCLCVFECLSVAAHREGVLLMGIPPCWYSLQCLCARLYTICTRAEILVAVTCSPRPHSAPSVLRSTSGCNLNPDQFVLSCQLFVTHCHARQHKQIWDQASCTPDSFSKTQFLRVESLQP